MRDNRPAWSWLFFLQLALVILASVLAASGNLSWPLFSQSPFDKLGHVLAYGGLAFLGVAFFGARRRWSVIAALLVAATLEELSQRAFATRTFDLGDLAMNVLGIVSFGSASPARKNAAAS